MELVKGKASGDGERAVQPTHAHAPRRSTARLVVSGSIHVRGTDCTERVRINVFCSAIVIDVILVDSRARDGQHARAR